MSIGHGSFITPEDGEVILRIDRELKRLRAENARLSRENAELRAERDAGLEAGATCADQWDKPSVLLLAAGEMSAQELRTARAVARGIARAIRALKSSTSFNTSAPDASQGVETTGEQ